MQVVEAGDHNWFLFRHEGELLLDVRCDHSAFGYSVLLKMSPEEISSYTREGRAYLDRFAIEVHMGGPGSTNQRRHIAGFDNEMVAAVNAWREENGIEKPL